MAQSSPAARWFTSFWYLFLLNKEKVHRFPFLQNNAFSKNHAGAQTWTVCSPKPLARLRTNVGSLENCHRRMAFLRCADGTSPPPKAWFFPRRVRMKIFSFVRRRNFIYEFFAIKISATFCKANRVRKLGQSVSRHQIWTAVSCAEITFRIFRVRSNFSVYGRNSRE